MKTLLIDAGRDSTQIFEEILNDIMFTSESFTVILEEDSIIVDIVDEENSSLYIDYIASKVTDFILNFIEPRLIREEVELRCLDLLDEGIEEDITKTVEWKLLHKDEKLRQNYFYYLKEDIFDGFENHGMFNLFGFLNFKLNMRRLEVKDHINITLEEYFSDENEEQFISLIRRFVSIQQPQIDLMNIIILGPNDYELITGNMERVDMQDVEKIIDELIHDKSDLVEQLHLILSLLMTLVPEDIKIHTDDKQDPYIQQALRKIYGDRVTTCNNGCDFCDNIRIIREEEDDK